MCRISSSLASSIITNHETPSSLNEPNSLEMLQKTTEDVLDSASQGILSGNLIDELAFRKSKSADGDDRTEPACKHRCRYCSKIFGSDSALQIHLRSHTGERPFKCNVCSSRFTTRGNLKVHYQRHTQIYPHLQMNPNPMPEHMEDMHKASIFARLSPPPPPPPTSSFPYPSRALMTRLPLYRHTEYPKLSMSHERHFTRASTKSDAKDVSSDLSQSLTANYGRNVRATNGTATSDAEETLKNINSQASRTTHDAKANLEPYSVQLGGEQSWQQFVKTSETSKLQKLVDNIEHKLIDSNECTLCHRILPSPSALEHHYKMHPDGCDKSSSFQCQICERAFTTKGNLKAHMSIHERSPSTEMLPQCPVCHKRFMNALVLEQHMKEHVGGRSHMSHDRIRDLQRHKPSADVDDDYNEEELLEDEAYNNMMHNRSVDNVSVACSDDSDEFVDRKSEPPIRDMRDRIAMKSTEPPVTPVSQHTVSSESGTVRMEQSSPTPSELSQSSALDLRPRQLFSHSPSSSMNNVPSPHHHSIGMFPNFPFLSQHSANSPSPLQYNAALNSLAHSVMPSGSFNPLGFPGIHKNENIVLIWKIYVLLTQLNVRTSRQYDV